MFLLCWLNFTKFFVKLISRKILPVCSTEYFSYSSLYFCFFSGGSSSWTTDIDVTTLKIVVNHFTKISYYIYQKYDTYLLSRKHTEEMQKQVITIATSISRVFFFLNGMLRKCAPAYSIAICN